MKIIQRVAIGICLLTSVTVNAQTENNTAPVPAAPVIDKGKAPDIQGEKKKKEYQSKQWKQGIEVIADKTNGDAAAQSLPEHKEVRSQPPSPPPPPVVAPPTPSVSPAPPSPPTVAPATPSVLPAPPPPPAVAPATPSVLPAASPPPAVAPATLSVLPAAPPPPAKP